MSHPSSTIRGRVDLSQRTYELPDGTAARLWSLAPARHAKSGKTASKSGASVPKEHREALWLLDSVAGLAWWAVVDLRTNRAVTAVLHGKPTARH